MAWEEFLVIVYIGKMFIALSAAIRLREYRKVGQNN